MLQRQWLAPPPPLGRNRTGDVPHGIDARRQAGRVWGEVSGGVNFFNPEAQTAFFTKVDYIFGDQTEGISARGGMRLTW